MAVFRVERTKDYTTMSNHHLKNKTLSLKAKGLLSQILSLPDDWDYTLSGLAALNREGVDAIRTAIQELEKAGYIRREFARAEGGVFDGNVYTIYEKPVGAGSAEVPDELCPPSLENPTTVPDGAKYPPLLDSPLPDNPLSENPTQLSTNRLNTKKNPCSPQGQDTEILDALFERFWKAYPKRVKKLSAEKAWDKLKPNLETCRVMSAALDRFKASDEWARNRGAYIPHPASWLNARRWEDEDIWHETPGEPDTAPATRWVDAERVPTW